MTPRADLARARAITTRFASGESIHISGQVVYLRPFGEMNLPLQPVLGLQRRRLPRAGHSTQRLQTRVEADGPDRPRRQAEQDQQQAQGTSACRASTARSETTRRSTTAWTCRRGCRSPKVAFMWTPLTRGSPDVPGNGPNDYFPGRKYVDWVGTDVYSKFSNSTLWNNLEPLLQPQDEGYPFVHRRVRRLGQRLRRDVHPPHPQVGSQADPRTRTRLLPKRRSPTTSSTSSTTPALGSRSGQILDLGRYASYAPGTKD